MASQKKWGKRQESEQVLRSDVAVVVAATGLQLLARQSGACTPPPGCGIQKSNIAVTSEEGLVEEKEFPWVVSLQDSQYTHLTFGTILSDFWILSIASTFQNRPVPRFGADTAHGGRVGSGGLCFPLSLGKPGRWIPGVKATRLFLFVCFTSSGLAVSLGVLKSPAAKVGTVCVFSAVRTKSCTTVG